MTADRSPVADSAHGEVSRDVTFVDASALVALADRDDASHAAAVTAYQDLVASGFRLFTTDLALAAAHELIAVALACASPRWGHHASWSRDVQNRSRRCITRYIHVPRPSGRLKSARNGYPCRFVSNLQLPLQVVILP